MAAVHHRHIALDKVIGPTHLREEIDYTEMEQEAQARSSDRPTIDDAEF